MSRWLPLLLACSAFAQSPVGHYLGSLDTPAGKLRLGLSIRAEGEGLVSEMISLDQNFAKVPVALTKLEDAKLTLSIPQAFAGFAGSFNEDFSRLSGKFTQGKEMDLVFERVPEIPRPLRPQHPQPPFPYRSEEVSFPSKAEGVSLAGTLTLPTGAGPFPVAVLLSGSGPQDRDETLMQHKPFLVLADHLTRQGFAVLRYDDRGIGQSTGVFRGATSLDFAEDARGAVAFLRSRQDLDSKRIALVGHSEGGILAPLVAASDPAIAALVLLAAPGVSGEAILKKQTVDLARAAGMNEDGAQAAGALGFSQLTARKEQDPWLAFFWTHDPVPVLEKVQCPVLALNGSLDMQVNADVNLEAIRAALSKAENKRFSAQKLEKLNHLFQTAETGAGIEYGRIEETFAPTALRLISDWLRETLPAVTTTPPAA